jgi:S1-C subfamily serine protease
MFRRFFGDGPGSMPRERVQASLGSGVIVDRSGLVVTNNHVIRSNGQTEVKVALADRREFEATSCCATSAPISPSCG